MHSLIQTLSPNLEPVARKRLKMTTENEENVQKNAHTIQQPQQQQQQPVLLDLDLKSKVRFIEEQNMRYLHKIREE